MRLDGRVVSHTDYSAYGETETSGEPNAVSDFRYARMLYHEPSSLYLTLYRAYDPALGRWLTRDPIGEVSFNVYAYVEGNPISFSDPFGLETYGCTKPLHALGKFGQWVYNPNNNDLFHEFLCVKVGDKYVCGGQDRSGGPYSPGKPSDDTFDKDQCKPLSPPCNVDDCVKKAINDPTRPFYGLKGVGTNCQEWAEDVYARCIRQCQGR
jgi:RHS repeat-associated protein